MFRGVDKMLNRPKRTVFKVPVVELTIDSERCNPDGDRSGLVVCGRVFLGGRDRYEMATALDAENRSCVYMLEKNGR